MKQIKKQLRKTYLIKKMREIILKGGNYHYQLHHNAAKIVSTLNREIKGEIKIIGSYIPLVSKEIIPPFLDTFKYAFPFFRQTTKEDSPSLIDFKLHRPGIIYTDRAYGIKLPPIEEQSVTPDLIFVPLTCFNPISKHRIGFGRGYYDLFIRITRQQQANIKFIGIGLQALKQERTIFWEQNDQSLDYVITEKAIY